MTVARQMNRSRAVLLALLVFSLPPAAADSPSGLALGGEEVESFLATAEVVKLKTLPVGVTSSSKATLSDRGRVLHAVWKTIDEHRQMIRFADGTFELNFRDTYKHEVAAYELDKLLGMGLVPPTVERKVRGQRGAMQLWIEEAMTEFDRRQRGLKADDPVQWNRQMHKVRLFHQLTYNTDFNNIRNILVTQDFRIFAIDHSRAFRLHEELMGEADLERFSRSVLDRLASLDEKLLKQGLGRWLTKRQIAALLERADLILARAEKLTAERGEKVVLYP
jgi:hypothetical protein